MSAFLVGYILGAASFLVLLALVVIYALSRVRQPIDEEPITTSIDPGESLAESEAWRWN